jgi:AraC family transcriptional regulator
VIAFPRTAVWIEREGERPFVSDPTTAVLHTPGREYERGALSREGDETDWIAVAEPLVREIVAQHSPRDAEAATAFPYGRAPVPARLYRAQRQLFAAAADPGADGLRLEESTIRIVASVIERTYAGRAPADTAGTRAGLRRAVRRDLVEEAKALLATTLAENISVRAIATRLHVSPFHLCRTFRAATGRTLHEHRRELRLRLALGLVPSHRGTLSALALDLGFHSHAHLTASFRKAFGVAPSSSLSSPHDGPTAQR